MLSREQAKQKTNQNEPQNKATKFWFNLKQRVIESMPKISAKKRENNSSVEAIQKLKEAENILAARQKILETKIEEEHIGAKKNYAKNREAALLALKKKKLYEKQLQQVLGTLSVIKLQQEAYKLACVNRLCK